MIYDHRVDQNENGIVVRPAVQVLYTRPAGEVEVQRPGMSHVLAFGIGLVVGVLGMVALTDDGEEEAEGSEAEA